MNLISLNNLYVQLDTANPVDVAVSWTNPDSDGSAGGDLVHVTGTTAKIIIPAPGTGYRRRMTDLNIRALAGNGAQVVATVYQGPDTSNLFEIMSAILRPGDLLTYDHQAGFKVIVQALLGNAMIDVYAAMSSNLLL